MFVARTFILETATAAMPADVQARAITIKTITG